jgi:hypothetical protein
MYNKKNYITKTSIYLLCTCQKKYDILVLKATTTKPVYWGSDTTYSGRISMVTPFSLDPFKRWRVSTTLQSATMQKTANFFRHLNRVIIKKIIHEISLACSF